MHTRPTTQLHNSAQHRSGKQCRHMNTTIPMHTQHRSGEQVGHTKTATRRRTTNATTGATTITISTTSDVFPRASTACCASSLWNKSLYSSGHTSRNTTSKEGRLNGGRRHGQLVVATVSACDSLADGLAFTWRHFDEVAVAHWAGQHDVLAPGWPRQCFVPALDAFVQRWRPVCWHPEKPTPIQKSLGSGGACLQCPRRRAGRHPKRWFRDFRASQAVAVAVGAGKV